MEKGGDGLVQVLHGQMPELNRPSNSISGVRFGNRHLIMRIICPASPVVGFENEFPPMGNQ